jgi:hypothetical protein
MSNFGAKYAICQDYINACKYVEKSPWSLDKDVTESSHRSDVRPSEIIPAYAANNSGKSAVLSPSWHWDIKATSAGCSAKSDSS